MHLTHLFIGKVQNVCVLTEADAIYVLQNQKQRTY